MAPPLTGLGVKGEGATVDVVDVRRNKYGVSVRVQGVGFDLLILSEG